LQGGGRDHHGQPSPPRRRRPCGSPQDWGAGGPSPGVGAFPQAHRQSLDGANAMIVDVHAHVIAPDQQRYPFSAVDGNLSETIARRLDTEQLLGAMDEAGVDRALLVQFAHVHP
jgi:hypothetical protein